MIFNPTRSVLSIVALLLATVTNPAQAEITLTPGNDTGTVLIPTPAGNPTNPTDIEIKGGVTAVNNLFHSFQKFGLNAGQTATFTANPNIQNILGRVVGGEASVINGIIKVTAGSNTNLYLMNPAGIIFGAGASLSVPGSFTATTANGIGFGTDKWFSAMGTNTYADLIGNPTSLAFTMSQPGAIVNAGNLSVSSGSTLVLVGGTVVSSTAIASQGGITIMAVPGSNLVRISQTGSLLSLEIPVAIGSTRPNTLPSDFSILSLPQLLTGGTAGTANGLTVNGRGQVTVTSSGAQVNTGDVVTGDISGASSPSNSSPLSNLSVFANAGISVGSINRNLSNTSALGTVRLAAQTGNITVSSILAGGDGIFITTPGTFRATSPDPIRTNALRGSGDELVIGEHPDLIDFLVSQGIPRVQLVNSTSRILVQAQAEGNVVALGINSVIRIQHGGNAAASDAVNRGGSPGQPRISIQTAPNTTNPVAFVTGGFDGFLPNSTLARDFDPSLKLQGPTVYRAFVRPNQFPEGVSGSAVGIYVGNTDSQLYASLQSRPFVPPPVVAPPVPPPVPPGVPIELPVSQKPIATNPGAIQQIQTSTTQPQTTQTQASTGAPAGGTGTTPASIQRPQVDRTPNSSCTPADQPAESRSRDRRSTCTINPQDDAQILKILNEPVAPEQRKEIGLGLQPQQGSWWQIGRAQVED